MATKAELTKKVDDLTAAATTARTTWKEAIPGPDDPKMTDAEQAEVDRLEEVYNTAKAARKAAEKELAAWIEAQRVAASAGTPVNTPVAISPSTGVSSNRRGGRRAGADRRHW